MQTQAKSGHPDDVVLVCAADDGYAMPLAVSIRSLIDHLGKDRRVRLFVLDGGLSASSRERLLKSWNDSRLTVEFVKPDLRLVADLKTNGHITISTYLRLLMPEILPSTIARAIYLDADVLVQRDIGELWDVPMQGHAALAAQDVAAPWINAAETLPNFNDCKKLLSTATPISNYQALGIDPKSAYFNAGVMLADLNRWRAGNYTKKCLACLREHREHVLFWDQYALNVVLDKHWEQLDRRWNQAAHIYLYPTWKESPLDQESYDLLRSDPWIVHFCSPSKPWHYFCRHPFAKEWKLCQEKTKWRGERPKKFLKRLWDYHYRPIRQGFKRKVKSVKEAVHSKLRKAA